MGSLVAGALVLDFLLRHFTDHGHAIAVSLLSVGIATVIAMLHKNWDSLKRRE